MTIKPIDRNFFDYLSYLGDGTGVAGFLEKGANPKAENSYALLLITESSATSAVKLNIAKVLMEAGADIRQCPEALVASLQLSGASSSQLSMFFIEQGADVHHFNNIAFALAINNKDYGSLTRLAQNAKEPVDVSPFVAMFFNENDEPEEWADLLDELSKYPNLLLSDDVITHYAEASPGAWYMSDKLKDVAQPAKRLNTNRL